MTVILDDLFVFVFFFFKVLKFLLPLYFIQYHLYQFVSTVQRKKKEGIKESKQLKWIA